MDIILKGGAVTAFAGQVVQRHAEFAAKGLGKQPFHRLRLNFHLFKQRLLFRRAAPAR